jgi:energy-coupling factor transporter ATP-binding protein EcfA2
LNIELFDLTFQYKNNQPIFEHLNLSIPLQRWVVITGSSGSGKTTLVKLIAGLLKPNQGRIIFPGNEINRADFHFGYLFQNPDDQLIHFNIERELAFNLENRGTEPRMMRIKVENVLRGIELFERRAESPNNLSGGEKQQLALAGMMISQPQILILDEPCSFLDIFAQMDLQAKIKKLRQGQLTILWISQEDHEIRLADYVICLKQGQVIFTGEVQDYFKRFGKQTGEA